MRTLVVAGVADPGSGWPYKRSVGGDPGYSSQATLRQQTCEGHLGGEKLSSVNESGHLKRLNQTWQKQPIYFITVCVAKRRPILACEVVHAILREEWAGLRERHGWAVGRYVVMPDHVHFFVLPLLDERKGLSAAIGKWKEWTAKRVLAGLGGVAPLWQSEFFDHVLRSSESRSEKWEYVRENPVREGLVALAEDWPFAGAIDFE